MLNDIFKKGSQSVDRLSKYLQKNRKREKFASPALNTLNKLASKSSTIRTLSKLNKINKPKIITKNKGLNKIVEGLGSMVVTAANQKSYHKGMYLSTSKEVKAKSWWDASVSGVKGAAGWTGNKAKSLWDASVSGVKGAVGWTGNKAKSLWDASVSGAKGAAGWTGNKAKSLWDASVSGVKGAVGWIGNKAKSLWGASVSGVKGAAGWTGNKAKSLWDASVSGVKGAAGWIGNKATSWWEASKEWFNNIDFKGFFDVTDNINDAKGYVEHLIKIIKGWGMGVHPKIEGVWNSPWAKKIRKFGNRAFSFLDYASAINGVIQAPTPDEKIIELNKAVFSKAGSAGLGALGGFIGGFLPAQPVTIPIFSFGGAQLGDWLGEMLGEVTGKGLTKIWPKTWWPYRKEKTSKIKPTRNMNLDKGKTQSAINSMNKSSSSQNIKVNLPTGAIQISTGDGNQKVDYESLVSQISTRFVKELRRAMENRRSTAMA